jgi:ABC-type multidrug transport system fused ATPase/permease subunit
MRCLLTDVVAHRLRSIIDYDKILVLDAGLIKEYDHPHVLLQQQDSIFRSMCASSGELEALEDLAKQAYEKVK